MQKVLRQDCELFQSLALQRVWIRCALNSCRSQYWKRSSRMITFPRPPVEQRDWNKPIPLLGHAAHGFMFGIGWCVRLPTNLYCLSFHGSSCYALIHTGGVWGQLFCVFALTPLRAEAMYSSKIKMWEMWEKSVRAQFMCGESKLSVIRELCLNDGPCWEEEAALLVTAQPHWMDSQKHVSMFTVFILLPGNRLFSKGDIPFPDIWINAQNPWNRQGRRQFKNLMAVDEKYVCILYVSLLWYLVFNLLYCIFKQQNTHCACLATDNHNCANIQ